MRSEIGTASPTPSASSGASMSTVVFSADDARGDQVNHCRRLEPITVAAAACLLPPLPPRPPRQHPPRPRCRPCPYPEHSTHAVSAQNKRSLASCILCTARGVRGTSCLLGLVVERPASRRGHGFSANGPYERVQASGGAPIVAAAVVRHVGRGREPVGHAKSVHALRKPAGNVANSIKKPRLLVDGSRKLPRTPESPYRPRTPDESTGALHLTRWCSMAQRFHASTREES